MTANCGLKFVLVREMPPLWGGGVAGQGPDERRKRKEEKKKGKNARPGSRQKPYC